MQRPAAVAREKKRLRRDDPSLAPDDENNLPSDSPAADPDGPSALLIDEPTGGLTLDPEAAGKAPAAPHPPAPAADAGKPSPLAWEEAPRPASRRDLPPPPDPEESSLLLLDELPSPGEQAAPPDAAPEASAAANETIRLLADDEDAPPPPSSALFDLPEDSGPSLLLLDEGQTGPAAESARPPMPPPEADAKLASEQEERRKSGPPAGPAPDAERAFYENEAAESLLLIDEESERPIPTVGSYPAAPPKAAAAPAPPDSPRLSPDATVADINDNAPSPLLLGAEPVAPSTPRTPSPVAPPPTARKGRKPVHEKVKVVTPPSGAPVEWFANPQACAVYCRKHRRPLLVYFTTGDEAQCRTYEEAVRMPEFQTFLGPYVCCRAHLGSVEGQEAARRLGLPDDGPAMVVLAPSGREYARILKPEVDWQFLATMLFWALR